MIATIFKKNALFLMFLFLCTIFHESKAMEQFKNIKTPWLQEFATLLHEQQFFLECVDGILNKCIPDELNPDVAQKVSTAYLSTAQDLDREKKEKLMIEDCQDKTIKKYSCLLLGHLLSMLKKDQSYDPITKGVEYFEITKFPKPMQELKDKLLKPLRGLLDILRTYTPMKIDDPKFTEIHGDLLRSLEPICQDYVNNLREIKRTYDDILDELLNTHRQRERIPLQGHFYFEFMLPQSYEMSDVYVRMFEEQSKAQIASLLASTKESHREEPATIAQKELRTSKKHTTKKKKSEKGTQNGPQTTQKPVEQIDEQIQEVIALTPEQQNDLRMKHMYAAFQFQTTWMQKLWDASNQPSTKLKPILDKIVKIAESDERFSQLFSDDESIQNVESFGDLQFMQRILVAIKQSKGDTRSRIINEAIKAWHNQQEESQNIEKIGQIIGYAVNSHVKPQQKHS